MTCKGLTGKFIVLSQRQGTDEGTEPFLEAVFPKKSEAQLFASSWNDFYPNGDVNFWVESK